jgi:predicted GNAT family acetyltransferase
MVEYQLLRGRGAGKPLVTIKIPKIKEREFVTLPLTSGPFGYVRFRRAAVGEITPVNIEPVLDMRRR